MSKYLARFWVDVNIFASDEAEARRTAKRLQRHIGLDSDNPMMDINDVEEYDTQFERFLKVDDEYVKAG